MTWTNPHAQHARLPPGVSWSWEQPTYHDSFGVRLGLPFEASFTFRDCKPCHNRVHFSLPNAFIRLLDVYNGEVCTSAGWHTYQEISYTFEITPLAGDRLVLPATTVETDLQPMTAEEMQIPILNGRQLVQCNIDI